MTAALRTNSVDHAVAFASWLQQHAGLLQALQLQPLEEFDQHDDWLFEPAATALSGALLDQQQQLQGLRRFTLNSNYWAAGYSGVLLQLPTSLHMLDLSGGPGWMPDPDYQHVLSPITR
uniref:Uncharacterized protein n=1 Tax=Tetradesmus obliquus TaxID=3088 RepID=A0A383W6Z0_TETOB|eukprot:jgi/Sobl393_1/14076/SZX72879.1